MSLTKAEVTLAEEEAEIIEIPNDLSLLGEVLLREAKVTGVQVFGRHHTVDEVSNEEEDL